MLTKKNVIKCVMFYGKVIFLIFFEKPYIYFQDVQVPKILKFFRQRI